MCAKNFIFNRYFFQCAFLAIVAVALAAPAPEPQPKASVGLAYSAPAVIAPAVSVGAPISYSSYVAPSVYSYGNLPYGYSPYVVV